MPSVSQMSSSFSTPNGAYPPPPIYYEDTAPQWLFTPEELAQYTPSRIERMPEEVETVNRRKGINFITQVGIALKLDQITLATASIYFQRFYMRNPLQIGSKGAHHYQIAATSVYVAYKSKENPRKMHELIVAVSRVAQKDPNLLVDEQSKEFWKWRETIQHHENLMLEVLCFDLDPSLPYPVLFEFLKYYGVQEHKKLRNVSWAVVTDSFTTPLCLLVQPQSVAGGALYLGLKHADVKLPDDEWGRPWWENLALDVREVETVLQTMLSTYENANVKASAGPEVYERGEDTMNWNNTRMSTPSGADDRTPRDHDMSQASHSGSNGSNDRPAWDAGNRRHDGFSENEGQDSGYVASRRSPDGSEEGELG